MPGVLDVRSASSRGSAQISVDFGWGRDMISSTLLIDAAISQILPSLPPGTGYTVRRMDPTVFPIISYALLSDTVSPVALQDLAQYQIVPLLSSIPGLPGSTCKVATPPRWRCWQTRTGSAAMA